MLYADHAQHQVIVGRLLCSTATWIVHYTRPCSGANACEPPDPNRAEQCDADPPTHQEVLPALTCYTDTAEVQLHAQSSQLISYSHYCKLRPVQTSCSASRITPITVLAVLAHHQPKLRVWLTAHRSACTAITFEAWNGPQKSEPPRPVVRMHVCRQQWPVASTKPSQHCTVCLVGSQDACTVVWYDERPRSPGSSLPVLCGTRTATYTHAVGMHSQKFSGLPRNMQSRLGISLLSIIPGTSWGVPSVLWL